MSLDMEQDAPVPTSVILRRFYQEVWEGGRLDVIERYFHPETPDHILIDDRAVEPHEVREWMEILRSLVTNMKVEFIHTVDEGDWSAALMRVRCDCNRTHKPIEVYQQIMSRQKDGKLIESYPQFDLLRFFEQLDQLPENAYALLMGGFRLG